MTEPNDYRGMVPDHMRTHTDRLMAAIDPFASVLFVTTGGNCTALEVRPFGASLSHGDYLMITNADAEAPLLDLDGNGPDLEIMVGVCNDDRDSEDDDMILHHAFGGTYNTVADDVDAAVRMVKRVVLSWLSARDAAERIRAIAADMFTIPVSVRYAPTHFGVAVHVRHPVVDSVMGVRPGTAWQAYTTDPLAGSEDVAESPDLHDVVNAVSEWLSV